MSTECRTFAARLKSSMGNSVRVCAVFKTLSSGFGAYRNIGSYKRREKNYCFSLTAREVRVPWNEEGRALCERNEGMSRRIFPWSRSPENGSGSES